MLKYSEKLIDHFQNPRNVGIIEDADGVGKLSSDVCGDIVHLYLRVENQKISDAKFTTFGCAAAVASGSMLTEMIIGSSLEEAEKITKQDIADNLDGWNFSSMDIPMKNAYFPKEGYEWKRALFLL